MPASNSDGNRSEGGFTLRRELGRVVVQGSFAAGTLDLSLVWKARHFRSGQPRVEPHADRSRPAQDHGSRSPALRRRGAGRGSSIDHVAASALLKGGRLALTVGEAEAWNGSFRAAANIAASASGPAPTSASSSPAPMSISKPRSATCSSSSGCRAPAPSVSCSAAAARASPTLPATLPARSPSTPRPAPFSASMSPACSAGWRAGRYPAAAACAAAAPRSTRSTARRRWRRASRISTNSPWRARRCASPWAATSPSGAATSISRASPAWWCRPRWPARPRRASFDLPFVAQGPWDSPFLLPDPQALIRRSGAARPLLGTEAIGVVTPAP